MTKQFKQMQPVLAHAAAHFDEDVSLAALAGQAGLSLFHLQRVFAAAVGETPKQLTLRLRLTCAAVMLITGRDSVLDVALSCGFQSHEGFCRAFRRRFGMTPSAYRERGFVNGVSASEAKHHAALVTRVSPCIGLYHISDTKFRRNEMTYAIVKKEVSPQPVLMVRRRIKPSEIASVLAEAFPHIHLYAERNGIALAGPPFTRYVELGPGLWTIEAGMPVAGPGHDPHTVAAESRKDSDEAQIKADTLPGGFVATMTHAGPYEKLPDTHAAIQQWIEAQSLVAAGAPWEVYVTDPADYPDPKDWKTDVFWPLAH